MPRAALSCLCRTETALPDPNPTACNAPDGDSQLMLRAAGGDAEAFEAIYRAHVRHVRQFILARRGHAATDVIDDLTQEVFARLWRQRRTFRGECRFTTYLFGIGLNVLREDRRQQLKASRVDDLSAVPEPQSDDRDVHAGSDEVDLLDAIHRARVELTREQWQAVQLVCLDRRPAAEAASIAGCSIDVLRNRLCRARKTLSRILAAYAVSR
jgi:RNA polymerase sigma-70 factor, ECF subfamily